MVKIGTLAARVSLLVHQRAILTVLHNLPAVLFLLLSDAWTLTLIISGGSGKQLLISKFLKVALSTPIFMKIVA